jgi:hypothetical protein
VRFTLLLLFAYFVAFPAYADDVRKYRDYTPQQLSRLPKERLKSEVPIMYHMAAQRGLSVGSDVLFGMELNQLMYPELHDYSSAVKAFQADLSDKPTGELTVGQIHQLEQRSSMQKLTRVGFPEQFSSYITDDYAAVQGTMIIVDDKIAWPVNHMRISCSKSERICDLDQVHLILPNEHSWSQTYQVMESSTETYEVARWGQDSIESHPLGTSKDCRNTSLSLNFKNKEFYFITRNAGGDCKLMLGGELEKLAKARVAQVDDGAKIIQEKFTEVQHAAYNVLSSAFRKRVEILSRQEQAK